MRNEQIAALFAKAERLFADGHNVVASLSRDDPALRRLAVEIAYSLQSGDYTRFAATEIAQATRREGHRLVEPLLREHGIRTILDCGIGEATRWFDFNHPTEHLYGLDASFHRLLYARRNLRDLTGFAATTLVKGNMTRLPFMPGAVDAVFTCHAVEPNTDADAERILDGLFTVARRLVVLMEPNYRDATPEMRRRMEEHGYARNIWDLALARADYAVVAEGTLQAVPNPLNRTSYLVLRRRDAPPPSPTVLCSPIDRAAFDRVDDMLIDANQCLGFPVFRDIHCLAPEDGVFLGCRPGD